MWQSWEVGGGTQRVAPDAARQRQVDRGLLELGHRRLPAWRALGRGHDVGSGDGQPSWHQCCKLARLPRPCATRPKRQAAAAKAAAAATMAVAERCQSRAHECHSGFRQGFPVGAGPRRLRGALCLGPRGGCARTERRGLGVGATGPLAFGAGAARRAPAASHPADGPLAEHGAAGVRPGQAVGAGDRCAAGHEAASLRA
mmetsp:Transcript_47553/g.120807  ORF Transcript_47553/g.120807 Transcript_47553/m.120807 type:complete len:200 (-) Transcript_47553:48-647(-)